MTVIAAFVWAWRTDRRPVPLGILAIGVGALGYILDKTFVPLPAAPFDLVLLAAVASVLLGAATLLAPGPRGRLRQSALLAVTTGAAVTAEASTTQR